MRYAICNELFQDWSFDRACEFSRRCGYTGLEIAPFTLAQLASQVSAAERANVLRTAQQHDLEIIGLHWLLAKTEGLGLTSADPDIRRRTSDYLIELAQLCHDLGGHIMVLGSPQQRNLPPGMSHDQGMAHAAMVIDPIIEDLERLDVTLALEPLGPQEGNFLLTADSGVELIRHLGSPFVRLHLDVKAMSSERLAIDENIRRHAPWMVHFHANDPNRQGPGMGDVDFAPIFQALLDVGYDGWVSVEVFDYSPGIERLAEASIEYMRRIEAEITRPRDA
ncbi:MAG: sugar phosphate isomerase/epimerase family protein [Pirellulales bacterium]